MNFIGFEKKPTRFPIPSQAFVKECSSDALATSVDEGFVSLALVFEGHDIPTLKVLFNVQKLDFVGGNLLAVYDYEGHG